MNDKVTSEEVYEDLLNRIINVELEPGRRISENEMCNHYNVSRSVIRTAFTRLAQYDLLTIYPQRGTYVNLINLSYIRQALLIRVSVEKEILHRFMLSKDKEETICLLEKCISEQGKYYHAEDYVPEFKKLDEEFHNLILSSVGSGGILELLDGHLLHISRWRNVYVRSGYGVSRLIDEHSDILKSIKSGDVEHAMESMSTHIETVGDMVNVNREFTHYFE